MNNLVLLTGVAAGIALLAAGGVRAQNIGVRINGEPVEFTGFGPRQIEGRVMVPLRGVLEKLGAAVDWVPATHTVVASRGDLDLELPIGSRTARVNGRDVPLDVPAMTLGGSTMVPLRFVGETLGADIRWDAPTQTVLITTSGADSTAPQRVRNESPRTAGAGRRDRDRDPQGNDRGLRGGDRDALRQPPLVNPPVQPAVSYTVDSLTHNHRDGWLRAGDVLNVRMRGTPGAAASFRIPGVADVVMMRETSPGVYEGSWTVPGDRPLDLTDAAVIGSLRSPDNGTNTSPLVQSGDLLRIDTAPPKVSDLTPAPKTQVTKAQPLISATFSDQGGSGVAPDRTQILVDGRDVTNDATITGQFFTYTPKQALPGGRHNVQILTYDRAGNESRQTWSFESAAPVVDSAVAAPVRGITAIQTNAQGELKPGDVVNVAVLGMGGGSATWSLGPYRNMLLREEKPGVYTGQLRLRPGDSMRDAHIATMLALPDGRKFTDTLERAISVNAGPPPAPSIIFPGPNDQFSNPLVVRGAAQPNSTVRLKIDYQSRALGILGVRGTAASQEIKVGPDGKWASQPINLNTLFGRRDAEYTLSAVTVSSTDETSPVTTIRFR